jgi:hypothetical protein
LEGEQGGDERERVKQQFFHGGGKERCKFRRGY